MESLPLSVVESMLILVVSLFCIYGGSLHLQKSEYRQWYNHPFILLGIGLFFLSLLNLLGTGVSSSIVNKIAGLLAMVISFAFVAFCMMRSLLLLVKKYG